eukprot:XP_014625831.1 G-type lectin S-receptor-like serine/threonine-protein kinase At4g27290 isoform X3 [Glycine max]
MDQTIGLEECKAKCLDNCSCMAYVNLDISGQGSVCAMWFDDLIDIRLFAAGGQDVYVQIDASELERSDFNIKSNQNSGMRVDDMDLPVFDLSTIATTTSNFTVKNKIGEDGFGPAYKAHEFVEDKDG